LKAGETEATPLVTPILVALEIDSCDLTNRVNADAVCKGGVVLAKALQVVRQQLAA
jgi:hypothetical protein